MPEKKTEKKKKRTLIRDLGTGAAKNLSKPELKKIKGGCRYGDLKCSKLVYAATKLTITLPPMQPLPKPK